MRGQHNKNPWFPQSVGNLRILSSCASGSERNGAVAHAARGAQCGECCRDDARDDLEDDPPRFLVLHGNFFLISN